MGDLIKEALKSVKDMNFREKTVFAPLIFFTLLLGVYPALVLDIIGPSVESLVANYHEEIDASKLVETSMVKN
jgi:NADH-quinone oxidoreductase subunit M